MYYKTQDYYRLQTSDRLLALAGVPLAYLKREISLEKMNFAHVNWVSKDPAVPGVSINIPTQIEFLKRVLDNADTLGVPAVYAVGSFPTEQPSYELTVLICREYIAKALSATFIPEIKWINVGEPDWNYHSGDCANITVIHGLSRDSDHKKLEIAKDFIRRSSASTIIVAITTPNALEYAYNHLGTELDIVWQLGRTIHRKAGV